MTPAHRPATAADIEAFYGEPQRHTMRAWIWDLDGEPIALAGVLRQGGSMPPVIFQHLRPAARRCRKSLIRDGRAMLKTIVTYPTIAIADPDQPGSQRYLERLGLEHIGTSAQGELFIYRPEQG